MRRNKELKLENIRCDCGGGGSGSDDDDDDPAATDNDLLYFEGAIGSCHCV